MMKTLRPKPRFATGRPKKARFQMIFGVIKTLPRYKSILLVKLNPFSIKMTFQIEASL